MKRVNVVLSNLIQNGRVIVDIPGVEHIERAFQAESVHLLNDVERVVYSDEMCDGEKIAFHEKLLAET